MTTIYAKNAFLRSGWADDVRFRITDGFIESIDTDWSVGPDDIVADFVVPGIANAHSHAFQRALAGHTEQRGPADRDTFWSWRTQMYALARRVDADALRAIARQAYAEMLSVGYTSVAEFHYLHRDSVGRANEDAMLQALATAAADAGIRLTYIPILYERAGFGESEPSGEQRQFVMAPDVFIDHYESARETVGPRSTVGVGAHSLRAVTESSLEALADVSSRDGCPIHIHIAEQVAEVEQCIARYGARPVEWLLKEFSPDDRWCLVHATHTCDEELTMLSESRAVVCLCPSTEANLGDGVFPLESWLSQGGRIAIGSDSQATINPFEELRLLEYGQRLTTQTRNVAAIHDSHTGRSLFEQALEGGALACGQGSGQLQVGTVADLVTLDGESPVLAGHGTDSILDALVFSGHSSPINRVMVGGEWRVIDGVHTSGPEITKDFYDVVRDLWPETRDTQ
ncbi:MAG: formimidoylglutamate deiminase [Candidatus Rariloculaceae bacterium]